LQKPRRELANRFFTFSWLDLDLLARPQILGVRAMPTVTQLHVNGDKRQIAADPDRYLLSVLRDDLGLTGSKYGCGEGRCGACTVHIDGAKSHSCVIRVGTVGDKQVRTIESLAVGDKLHSLQQAFLEDQALQCGYCTPGMIMAASVLLDDNPNPSRDEIIQAMNGNICRCGVYNRIIAAIQRAAQAMKGGAR